MFKEEQLDPRLVAVAGGQLPHGACRDVHDIDVRPPVVVEPRKPLARGWLVRVAGDDHRVAVGVGLGPRRRRRKRDLLAVEIAGARDRRTRLHEKNAGELLRAVARYVVERDR